jgi:remodeling and spacing factor 1
MYYFSVCVSLSVPKPLVELHVKLLRKLGKSVSADKWERYLAKVSCAWCVLSVYTCTDCIFVIQVCQDINSSWAWELEHKGYQDMSMECKTSILKVRHTHTHRVQTITLI